MMKKSILTIGDNCSQNLTRYFAQIARRDGTDYEVVNLNMSNATLSKHYRNTLSDEKEYGMEYNGYGTEFFFSMKDALLTRDWDIVILQQNTAAAADSSSFHPYLNELVKYIKKYQPQTEIYLHQTWAFEGDSPMLIQTGYKSSEKMFKKIQASYEKAQSLKCISGTVRSGELIEKLAYSLPGKVYGKKEQVSAGIGCFALSLLLYKTVTGRPIEKIKLDYYDEPIDKNDMKIIKDTVNSITR